MQLYPRQQASIAQARRRLNIWDGSVRSGKTIASIVRWLQVCTARDSRGNPIGGNLLMVGKTERTLRRNVLDVIEQLVGPRRCKVNLGKGEATILGRRVYLMGANDEGATGKLQGLTLGGLYGDELTLWPKSFFAMALSRLSDPGAALYGTTNPEGPRHWLKVDYLDRADELDIVRFRFRLADNLGLDPGYVRALTAEYQGLWRQRYVDGLWVAAEGAVYDSFVSDGPMVAAAPDPRQLDAGWVAIDYGTTNPLHALRLRRELTPTGHRIRVVAEWRWDSKREQRQLTDAQYADALQGWWAEDEPPAIVVDPSATSFIAELRTRGLPVLHANNAVLDGIRTVARLLADGQLVIDPSCTYLIDELSGYVWDPKATAKGNDAPMKVDDHGPDALRYGVMADLAAGPVSIIDTEM